MGIIRIDDLHLRTIIGINDWERKKKQDILINIEMTYDSSSAENSDNISDALDYKVITKKIINEVEKSEFFLVEKLSRFIMEIILKEDKVLTARVRVDKPRAIRFSKSVSFELYEERRD